ncbi:hypothetical protein PHYPSEUDO_009335 [Phytophthora pseudosyringae]|uniref:Uncharacterized protein n=1 Tax=Phytophthora pseudosyringae TaxID=221518 RepID=A0A8T1VC90_9STRA|nr:hypothetical protein PHYPSEUDO_009335 [Phytophthora pseudosyringae]
MPRKSRRNTQIGRLADAKCSSGPRHQQPIRHVSLAELVGGSTPIHRCYPSLAEQHDSTSSGSDGSNFEGPNLFTGEFIFAKKSSAAGDAYYFVGWVGFPRLTWQPAAELPLEIIGDFERGGGGLCTVWPVDRRAFIPTGLPTGTSGRGRTAVGEVEAACVASATKHAEELIPEAAATATAPPPAPAGETTLSTHFDGRLQLEGSQRIALEGRVRACLGELEEWLQQIEGELGGSHFEPTASATSSSMSQLQAHFVELESSRKQQREEVYVKMKKLPDLNELQAQLDRQNGAVKALRDNIASVEAAGLSTREETRAVTRTSQGLKLIVETLVRDTGSAEELLQQYVSTITHQVASVTRQYVSVRIRDNNRLLDATLRARVPAYVANESESFLLVRPETKKEGGGHTLGTEVIHDTAGSEGNGNFSFVLREDDEDGIRRLLASQRGSKPSTIGTTISSDASAAAAAAGAMSSS